MSTHRVPDFSDEESPERSKDHQHGSDGDVFKEGTSKGGTSIRKVEEKDLNKDRDKNRTSIKEPDSGKQEVKEPPKPKPKPKINR